MYRLIMKAGQLDYIFETLIQVLRSGVRIRRSKQRICHCTDDFNIYKS